MTLKSTFFNNKTKYHRDILPLESKQEATYIEANPNISLRSILITPSQKL